MNPFTQTWSLGVEEQFYLVFPVVLWLLGAGSSVCKKNRIKLLLTILIAISYIYFLIASSTNLTVAYYSPIARAWELLLGSLIFMISAKVDCKPSYFKVPYLSVLFPSVLLLCVLMPIEGLRFSVSLTVIVTSLYLLSSPGSPFISSLLNSRVFQYLGTISYSLYLWHWGIIVLFKWSLGDHQLLKPIQILLILAASHLSYLLLEKKNPLPKVSILKLRRFPAIFITTGFTISIFALLRENSLYLGDRNPPNQYSFRTDNSLDLHDLQLQRLQAQIDLCHLTPQSNSPPGSPRKQNDNFLKKCLTESTAYKNIILVGDSFAQIISPLVLDLASKGNYKFHVLVGYGCPYPFPNDKILSSKNVSCKNYTTNSLYDAILNNTRKGDIVVIRLYLEKTEYLDYPNFSNVDPHAYTKAFADLASSLASKGVKLVHVGSNPTLTDTQFIRSNPQWYQKLFSSANNTFIPSTSESTAFFLIDRSLKQLSQTQNNYNYISTANYLCQDATSCRLSLSKNPLYSDISHLSPFAIKLLYKELSRQIN